MPQFGTVIGDFWVTPDPFQIDPPRIAVLPKDNHDTSQAIYFTREQLTQMISLLPDPGVQQTIRLSEIESAQAEQADEVYQNFQFDSLVIEDEGWETRTGSGIFQRSVYLEDPDNPDGPSIPARFVVEFVPGTIEVLQSYQASPIPH